VRGCAKAGCEEPAGVTIGLRYADRVVVMSDLAPRFDPNLLELCDRHADTLTLPRGWVAQHRRTRVGPPSAPPGA
jgi:Protein of unknown function (DUF3499)